MNKCELIDDLIRYLSGEVVDFSGHGVDLSGLTDFEQEVLCETRKIRYGSVVTYSELAARIGKPNAARAVGNALSKNPLPIVSIRSSAHCFAPDPRKSRTSLGMVKSST